MKRGEDHRAAESENLAGVAWYSMGNRMGTRYPILPGYGGTPRSAPAKIPSP